MIRLLRPFTDEGLATLGHGLCFVSGFNRLLFLVMLVEPDLAAKQELSDERDSSVNLFADVVFDDTTPWLLVVRFRLSLWQ